MERAFTSLSGVAAALPMANVDTDKIVPAEFLKTIERRGLGRALFHRLRYCPDGSLDEDFVLNRSPWSGACILVALDNFGSGSSREHAPWALRDFGIRAVIAPSFADIFRQNCIKNGILPAIVSEDDVGTLLELTSAAATCALTVDLETQTIAAAGGGRWPFEIDPAAKASLLLGADEIDSSLEHSAAIERALKSLRERYPWISAISR